MSGDEEKALETQQQARVVFTPANVESTENQQDNESLDAISAIPDGGLTAWLQCVGSFSLFFNSWGIVNTFGVFQTYYEESLLTTQSSSNISWIGSIQGFLLLFLGIITGPLIDFGHLRTLLLVGTFFLTLGMMMTSISTEYWQLVLSQGITVGLGCGCIWVPSVAIVPTYFSTRKSMAVGIGASGGSLGGIIYPIIFHKLEPQIGFPRTVRIMGFIVLVTLVFPVIFMKARLSPASRRRIVDLAAWQEVPYLMFGIGVFLIFMGFYIPFFYVQIYAIEKGILSQNMGFYLLALLNAGSFFGRLVPNYTADKTGPLNVVIACGIATSILGFAWIGIKTSLDVIIFCLLYGFFCGPLVSLTPSVVATLSPHPEAIGLRLGMQLVPMAFGLLVGNPIAGAILKTGNGDNWLGLACFCGASVLLSTVFVGAARVNKVGWRIEKKA